jgi:hypothetical protein
MSPELANWLFWGIAAALLLTFIVTLAHFIGFEQGWRVGYREGSRSAQRFARYKAHERFGNN